LGAKTKHISIPPPVVPTTRRQPKLRGHKRKQVERLNPLERLAHIAAELLTSKGSDGGDFTVGGFGLRVVAVVERLEQSRMPKVVMILSCIVHLFRECVYYTLERGEDLTRW
jgi:hypothetical protein